MIKYISAIVLLLFWSSQAYPQVNIREEHRVLNRSPGYCAWACLEMLGNHHKIEALYGLMEKRSKDFTWYWDGKDWIKSPFALFKDNGQYKWEPMNTGSHLALTTKLNELNVKFTYQPFYQYDRKMLKDAIKLKKGCLIVIKGYSNDTSHAVIALDYNEESEKERLEILDPNEIKNNYRCAEKWVVDNWLGYILVVEK